MPGMTPATDVHGAVASQRLFTACPSPLRSCARLIFTWSLWSPFVGRSRPRGVSRTCLDGTRPSHRIGSRRQSEFQRACSSTEPRTGCVIVLGRQAQLLRARGKQSIRTRPGRRMSLRGGEGPRVQMPKDNVNHTTTVGKRGQHLDCGTVSLQLLLRPSGTVTPAPTAVDVAQHVMRKLVFPKEQQTCVCERVRRTLRNHDDRLCAVALGDADTVVHAGMPHDSDHLVAQL
jgi:hypothetical protein